MRAAFVLAGVGLCLGLTACTATHSQPGEAQGGVRAGPTETSPGPAPQAKHHRKKAQRLERVARVIDGDTLALADGRHVRLVQIDTPELGTGECYSRAAASALRELVPEGSSIRLAADPALDRVDPYGRILRYAFRGRLNVNLELVRRGDASVWFYDGDRGRYADELLAAAERASRARRGAWGACEAVLDPSTAFATGQKRNDPNPLVPTQPGCEPGYDPCLPITGDLDCPDLEALGLAPVRVTGGDRYRLDGNADGVGCE
ncbi:MAG TPA: thermonuclease family protein [Gaiellaceae bacterium]|nr:thermonuclease family protein [Gaiellaceae bacterium]